MAKLQQVLNDEIRKQAHKEIIGLVKSLRMQISGLNNQVKELNSRVKALEKFHPKAEPSVVDKAAEQVSDKTVRVTPDRIRKWRQKAGLSQPQYAALLNVNAISVNHWENGKTVPRMEQKRKITILRDMNKRELKKLLDEKNISPKKPAAPKRAGGKKVSASAK